MSLLECVTSLGFVAASGSRPFAALWVREADEVTSSPHGLDGGGGRWFRIVSREW